MKAVSASVGLFVTLLTGCGGEGGEAKPRRGQNVLLITVDTLRADRLGCYGYGVGSTPNIDRLAKGGVLFEQAVAQVPLTLPSHASLLTGTYPPVNGVRDNNRFRLDPAANTMAETLGSHGYQTGAFIGSFVLDKQFGLSQGFALYEDRLPSDERDTFFNERSAGQVSRAFFEWLDDLDGDKPFFAWIHLFDPHLPYTPPSPFRERFPSSPYDGEIAYVDEQIGAILAKLDDAGLDQDTLIVFTADHGESLGEHGETSHGFFVYDGSLQVPLIMKSEASIPSGGRIGAQVRLVDVAPTVFALVDLPIPADVQGESLLAFLNGEQDGDLPAYGECYASQLNFGWAPLVSLRYGGFKYIDAPRPELYDLNADPGEDRNLFLDETARAQSMKRELDALVENWPESFSSRHQPDPESMERLRSLGYAGGGRSSPSDLTEGLADPKDRIQLWDKTEWVIVHLSKGDYTKAAQIAEEILEEDPTNLLAMEHLASSRKKLGDRKSAMKLYRRMISLADDRPVPHVYLGNLLWQEGKLDEAEREFRAALGTDARYALAHERLGYLQLSKGAFPEALKSFQRALEIDPERFKVRLGIARTYAGMGDMEATGREYRGLLQSSPENPEAVAEYALLLARTGNVQEAEQLLRSGPKHFQVHYTLSVVLRETKRLPEALAEVERTLKLKPDLAPGHHDHGVLLSRLGRTEEAIPSFEKALRLREDPLTRNALGTALCKLNRCTEAIPHFERAVELAPQYQEARENLAEAYRLAGRSE